MLTQAFSLWDNALESISFTRTDEGNSADITVALAYIDGSGGNWGYWNARWDGLKNITKATIRLEPGDFERDALTITLHEIGNVLGLGDILPTQNIRSVQKDPLPEMFQDAQLWADDIAMVKQLYKEDEAKTDSGSPTVEQERDEIIGNVITFKGLYGDAAADLISNYDPKSDSAIQIDLASFGGAADKLKIAKKSRQVAKLARKNVDFIYDLQAGYLYYNENGRQAGFGDGGMIAILEGSPRVGIGSFEFI